MGLLDKLFNHKDATSKAIVEKNYTITNDMNSILSILENLGVLRVEEILSRVSGVEDFDEKILTQLEIMHPEHIEYVEKYFGKARFGYGSDKIRQIKDRLQGIFTEKSLAGCSDEEIRKELVEATKMEIAAYRRILEQFNDSLKSVEETEKEYTNMISQIDYWKNYYKEQELGYPIPLDKKIVNMSKVLYELPYGGYGEEEIKLFVEAAKKMAEEGKISGESPLHTYNRIQSDLFLPRKNRYLTDVETLKRKLQMIDESPYISELEKEQNKQKTITEFNTMNGHHQNINNLLEQFKRNLTQLEFGGYGEEVINKFNRRAETIISDGHRIAKKEEEIKKEVEAEYRRLIEGYQEKLLALKGKLQRLDNIVILPRDKEKERNALIDEFHDEMGLPIAPEDRVNEMIGELKALEHGGYGDLKIEEFRRKAQERLNSTGSRTEIRDALKEIRDYQVRMIQEYQDASKKLENDCMRVRQDRHLSSEDKEYALDELEREFFFSVGYRMNFEKYLNNRETELRNLERGGYGNAAIEEFKKEAWDIIHSPEEEKNKYERIKQKFNALKKHYSNNLKTFEEWKKLQMKDVSRDEREQREKELDDQITYMLSLSPKALQDYYLEDDRKKKAEVQKHNDMVAFKYLARQEAKHQRDESLYQTRLAEYERGEIPYTREEMEEAAAQLELLSITSNELKEDEKIISLVEYIDSTLMRQMSYAEVSRMKSTSNT